jgi:hypothetical protein
MSFLTGWLVIAMIIGLSLVVLEFSRASKSWLLFTLTLCLLTRVAVAFALSGGLQYAFVVDSLNYEQKGWLLAQPWISPDLLSALAPTQLPEFNYYEVLVAWIFTLFGNHAMVATVINCVLSTATIGLMVMIYQQFLADQSSLDRKQSSLILAILLSVYPSFIVWSATNTRDPLYFFCCALFFVCFLAVFSPRSRAVPAVRLLAFAAGAFSIWLVLGVRPYVSGLFVVSIASGLVLYTLAERVAKRTSWKVLVLFLTFFVILTLYGLQLALPEQTTKWLTTLEKMRVAFANLKLLDSVAKSSFAIDAHFSSVTDVLLFLPNALLHYFFGPFPWEVASAVQAFALLEALAVYALIVPTMRGVRSAYLRAPFETLTLLAFAATFSISQSLVISNMGTLFRHRTLPFLFLLLFTCEGLHSVTKKNFPALFTA